MRIIITGCGKAGSWKIRGDQLGRAIGADVRPNADRNTVKKYDLAIFVKRVPSWVPEVPSIWDMVDCFSQPSVKSHHVVLSEIIAKKSNFTASIAATEKMRIDTCAEFVLPHHYREGIEESQVRPMIRAVGYEGSERYLGEWRPVIESECRKRGYAFIVNPARLSDCDLLIGVRGEKWRSPETDKWKSNVKMANAVAACVPFIGLPESGYSEMNLPFYAVNSPSDIGLAFDYLKDFEIRINIADKYREEKKYYSLDEVSKRYRAWIDSRF